MAANAVFAIVKGFAGYYGNSYALVADAIESSTDVFSSLILVIGLRYATRPADKNHPYGHGKAEPLVTFAIVAFLVVSAVIIAYKSVINIATPHEAPKSFTLIVLAVIIATKELFYRIVSHRGKKSNSTALIADAWHHRSDAITSLMAFIGISVALYFGEGYESADDWAALLASGFILYNAYIIFRPALSEIMDEHIHDDLIDKVRAISEKVPGVEYTEKCFARKSGLTYHIDMHLVVDAYISVQKGHQIAHEVKDELMKRLPNISDVLIHVEPNEMPKLNS